MINNTRTKLLLKSTATPAEIVQRAQVAIVTATGWHIIAQTQRAHSFDKEAVPLPAGLACPIVDLSNVEELSERVAEIMGTYTSPSQGVLDLPALLEALNGIGATVTTPCPFCEGTQKHCDVCTYGGLTQ